MQILLLLQYYILSTAAALVFLYIVAYFYSHYGIQNKCKEDRDIKNKNIIVTGGTAGIGKEVVKTLYLKGAVLIFTGRSIKKAKSLISELQVLLKKKLKKGAGSQDDLKTKLKDLESGTWDNQQNFDSKFLKFRVIDQASLAQVRQFTEWVKANFSSLDTLHCNAGLVSQTEKKTEEGFDLAMGVSHFSHYLMVHDLLDLLKATPESRVVTTTSEAQKGPNHSTHIDLEDFHLENSDKPYDPFQGYFRSKLANVLFTVGLNHFFKQEGLQIKAVSLHPGIVRTEFLRDMKGALLVIYTILCPIWWDCVEGSQTSLFCILAEWSKLKSGEYYQRSEVGEMNKRGRNAMYWMEFWNVCKREMKKKAGIECAKFKEFTQHHHEHHHE